MAHALEPAATSRILQSHPTLTFRDGRYSYSITRGAYSVTEGPNTITAPIAWSFGQGAAGQTYVFQRDGSFFESRVSFYRAIDGLDLTLGALTTTPRTLEEAAGRKMAARDTRDCFGCHSTGDTPGVQCERCHGDASRHLAAKTAMPKLSSLSTEDLSNLCGACHRTWAQIATSGPRGVLNVRFQPYRLTNSKCYDALDKRIGCTACHDPHSHTTHEASFYDAKCKSCHAAANKGAKICRTGKQDCAGCHMPKVELPGSHFAFTDHMIRIAKAGQKYPD